MSSFRWSDAVGRFLRERYDALPPGDVAGLPEWTDFVLGFPYPNAPDAWQFLRAIRQAKPRVARQCPRIFISHRHGDEPLALRIAWLAWRNKIEYWLDVIDMPPILAAGLPYPVSAVNQAILIAAIIEVALINCTHAIAVMTKKTSGSAWVPYEYGRIKDDPPGDLTVGSWLDSGVSIGAIPEYMHLAPIFTTESGIESWMYHERALFKYCTRDQLEAWSDDEPEKLPG